MNRLEQIRERLSEPYPMYWTGYRRYSAQARDDIAALLAVAEAAVRLYLRQQQSQGGVYDDMAALDDAIAALLREREVDGE
jgi:predicted transcriptional regulator